eukprot:Em0021g561a
MAQAQLPQWLVDHITYRDLCRALSDVESTVHWCQRHKLLAERKSCPKCGREMHLVKRKAVNKEEMGWRCPRKGCRLEVALRSGTFFEGSKLGIEKIMRMVYLWSVKTPLVKMKEEIEVAAQTAVDWYNFICDVYAQYFIHHPTIIGGLGVEVEIDESKFGKRKYNRGRQHIRPGSIIYSDEWKAYSRITATTGMSHETVNHSLHFVDPATGAHTGCRSDVELLSILFDNYFMCMLSSHTTGPSYMT